MITLKPIQLKRKLFIGIDKQTFPEYLKSQSILEFEYLEHEEIFVIPNTKKNLKQLLDLCRGKVWLDLSAMKQAMIQHKDDAIEHKRNISAAKETLEEHITSFLQFMNSKGLSENTKKVYLSVIELFFLCFKETKPDQITNENVEEFISTEIVQKGYSRSYQKQVVSALKCYYRNRTDFQLNLESLPKIKKSRTLPKVLSNDEVRRIIECTRNLKHRTILMIMYGCGLRIGELLNLRLTDIQSDRLQITIIQGKGFKDRVVPISNQILENLRAYYKAYKPKTYLFESTKPGIPYSRESVNQFLKRYAKQAGIQKRVYAHMLRHSYATHLLETGVSLRHIQELLGHSSSTTTEIYTYVSRAQMKNIPSPYDLLDL
ncbi:tyrosine-type recombinase/integrase [bacterium]|nr:tyrosine-type recombinase/integrase [bacterium]